MTDCCDAVNFLEGRVTCSVNMPGAAPSSDNVHYESRTYLSTPAREVTGLLPTEQFSYPSSKKFCNSWFLMKFTPDKGSQPKLVAERGE